jgi:cold-inducible RNA-binding protein
MFFRKGTLMSSKVFVGGLPWSINNDALKETFAGFGEVTEAKVILDRATGRSRGFGFVTFAMPEEAQKALELDGQQLQGRTIRVDLARESRENGRGPRPPRDDRDDQE